ncbi:MAG: hypothetical protein R2939_20100 [Kofleriaceae bacterium]
MLRGAGAGTSLLAAAVMLALVIASQLRAVRRRAALPALIASPRSLRGW